MNESFLKKLKRVRFTDLLHIFLFILAIIPSLVLKAVRPHIWLICESHNEARDNAYWLFRYICEEHPETDCVYAIDRCCDDHDKVSSIGKTVRYGSFAHWILYLAAEYNISTQKYGKPNAAVCYLLEVTLGILKNRRIFLQHGVTKDDLPFLHYDKAKLAMFCCAARPEYEFIKETFGYPEGAVQLLGFCRFDRLHGISADKDLILIVPTWRMELQREDDPESFRTSSYYQHWDHLLKGSGLSALLSAYGKKAVFVLHRNMNRFEDMFSSNHDNIEVIRWQDADITSLIEKAGVLITDFSSIYMDVAYMHRPVIYYQFDTEEYRRTHLPTGYFDYSRDGFGPICETEKDMLSELESTFS
ncbi:MAG: CDP-glycerol glycerophosphotransferase family protein, partial [Firmicutes bacterium]|nr:CDP-glycerol glycerophosphotransferase family protein [Bacillota bacterium]